MSFEWWESVAYAALFLATAVGGELVVVGAAALARAGHLDPIAVLLASALGSCAGDQAYFSWIRAGARRDGLHPDRPRATRERLVRSLVGRVSAMMFACRFLPTARFALPAACAVGGLSPLRFSLLSLSSSFAWTGGIVATVSWIGPPFFAILGVHVWWAPVLPALAVLTASAWLSRRMGLRPDPYLR